MLLKFFMPSLLLRAEGALIFLASTWMFSALDQSWVYYVLGVLAIDASMAGYLLNPRIGAAIYNLAHTLISPLVVIALAIIIGSPILFGVSLAWVAHIGIDRLFGFGLKYPTSFKETHLQDATSTMPTPKSESEIALESINDRRQTAKEQRKADVLAYIEEHGQITNNEVERVAGVSDSTASRYLDELEQEGIIRPVGDGRMTHYILTGSHVD